MKKFWTIAFSLFLLGSNPTIAYEQMDEEVEMEMEAITLSVQNNRVHITNAEGKDIDFSAPSCVLASNPTVYDEFYKIAKKVIDK
jgi:hypothetical protein